MSPSIHLYTLTSALHDEHAVEKSTKEFLATLPIDFFIKGNDYTDFGTADLDLIYVRTGGTEGIFRDLLPQLRELSHRPFRLLTSGKSNSLAASMEILSFLRKNGLEGEIIHGRPELMTRRISVLAKVGAARRRLLGARLGVIGKPSDWLISSQADDEAVRHLLGIEMVDIPMSELLAGLTDEPLPYQESCLQGVSLAEPLRRALPKALQIEDALRALVARYGLRGFTLRCFDLLTAVSNTGCLALAHLNADGVVAGCEGDVPAMLSMAIAHALLGVTGFQANPASIDTEKGEMVFAHCTIPLNMVERYEFDTHFESGIGIGIRGYMAEGPVTVFKVSGDLSQLFAAQGRLLGCDSKPDLCRTQLKVRLDQTSDAEYFLTKPIGNHHIILPGHHGELLRELIKV